MTERESAPELTGRELFTLFAENDRLRELVGEEYLEDLENLASYDEPIDEGEIIGGLATAVAMNGEDPDVIFDILANEGLIVG